LRAVALTTTLSAAAFSGYDNVVDVADDFCDVSLAALFGSAARLTKSFSELP
jgi:hypothetical protein